MDETLLRLANATGVVAFALGLAGSTLIGPTPRHPRSQWFMRSLAGSATLMAGVFLLVLGLSPAAIASSLAASSLRGGWDLGVVHSGFSGSGLWNRNNWHIL